MPMKQAEIVKVIAPFFGSSDLVELNQRLKDKKSPELKFRMTGKKLGHLGFTGLIKAITDQGLKVFAVKKVTLIRYEDIETFEKAKEKVDRPAKAPKSENMKTKPSQQVSNLESEDDFKPKKLKAKKTGSSGSKFIPQK